MTEPDPAADDLDDLPEQLRIRREKYDRLTAAATGPGDGPFPIAVARTHSLSQVRASYPELEPDERTGVDVGIAGRVIFIRNSGKLCFATLREDGVELQAMLSADRIGVDGPGGLDDWKRDVDLGDLVFVHGEVITSKRGELSVLADRWQLAGKALRPLPVAHRPLSEETRVRQRYVDLIVRPEARADGRDAGRPSPGRCARRCTPAATSRSRRRSCRPCTAAPRPVRSTPT